MSRICIGVLRDRYNTTDRLNEELQVLLTHTKLSISYKLAYDEPLLEQYDGERIMIFSLSDSDYFDTCEMLFLPDNCFYNGFENMMPFHKRMQNIAVILSKILEHSPMIDLFIGDSGTKYYEFEETQIHVHEFSHISNRLNTINPPDLHLFITV